MAISSPLLETSINGAKGVLVNVTGSMDIGLEEVETAANLVQEAAHEEANIIFGAAFDDTLDDEIRVTVIATGFEEAEDRISATPFSRGGEQKAPAAAPQAPRTLEPMTEADSKIEDDPFNDTSKTSTRGKKQCETARRPAFGQSGAFFQRCGDIPGLPGLHSREKRLIIRSAQAPAPGAHSSAPGTGDFCGKGVICAVSSDPLSRTWKDNETSAAHGG